MDFGTELALWFGEAWRQAGEPSYSLIQAKTGVSRTTINRVREGAPDITEETIEALARFLGAKKPTVQRTLVRDRGKTTAPGELIAAAQDYLRLAKDALTEPGGDREERLEAEERELQAEQPPDRPPKSKPPRRKRRGGG